MRAKSEHMKWDTGSAPQRKKSARSGAGGLRRPECQCREVTWASKLARVLLAYVASWAVALEIQAKLQACGQLLKHGAYVFWRARSVAMPAPAFPP